MVTAFEKELTALLNKHSVDAHTNTPGFILTEYLIDCLATYSRIKAWNEMWHSRLGVPVAIQEKGPPAERL